MGNAKPANHLRAVFTWLSKGIGFGFGFGFTTPFGWLVYLLWFWFYDGQVKTALISQWAWVNWVTQQIKCVQTQGAQEREVYSPVPPPPGQDFSYDVIVIVSVKKRSKRGYFTMGKIVIDGQKMTLRYSSPRFYWSIGDLTWRTCWVVCSSLGRLLVSYQPSRCRCCSTMPKRSPAKRDFRDNGKRKIKRAKKVLLHQPAKWMKIW